MVRLAWGDILGSLEGDGQAIVGLLAAAMRMVVGMLPRLSWGCRLLPCVAVRDAVEVALDAAWAVVEPPVKPALC